ncbi:hypothetical protein BV898_14196 [Hypsibius exemplaris]|uniref:PWWP domain-containing protein n=1 Tax=Hypsibius exemplaris TaxID=2072580 RepID=A0A1W0W8P6_HYPEX|nr:hypothetical protein BV898_14196 [Hypsibius exemplaris]
MAAEHTHLSVEVEESSDEVIMVSFRREDGQQFRGALLKIKSWPCPHVNGSPVSISPVEDDCKNVQEGETKQPLNDCVTLPLDPSVDLLNGCQQLTARVNVNGSEVGEEMQTSTDFAALQYRWSYFSKNPPPLPKRNLPSRKEKEKIEQVTKLRPRNFLCARCKFALPGFSQPFLSPSMSQQQPSPQPTSELEQTVTGTLLPCIKTEDGSAQPSHSRKRRVPLKRPATSRPLVVEAFQDSQGPEDNMIDESSRPKRVNAGKRQKVLNMGETSMNGTAEATILPSPSGEGLKIKFKLSNPVPIQVGLGEKLPSKRARRIKDAPPLPAVSVKEVIDEDGDEDYDLKPRLRIDEGDQHLETTEPPVPSPPPYLEPQQNQPTSVENTLRKRRIVRSTKVSIVPSSSAQKKEAATNREMTATEIDVVLEAAGAIPKPVARAVKSCTTKDGRDFAVGDIVWGKIVGYPWWPGAIKHIVVCDDPLLQNSAATPALADQPASILQYQEAQIEWFGQKASISYIEVNQLGHFGLEYQRKYKTKLRTCSYQEAVKLAVQASSAPTTEEEEQEQDVLSEIISETRERQKTQQQNARTDVYDFPSTEDPTRSVLE